MNTTCADFVQSPTPTPGWCKMEQFSIISLLRSPWTPKAQHRAPVLIWGMLAFKVIMVPYARTIYGPETHTSHNARFSSSCLRQVTVVLFQKYLTVPFTLANRSCLWSKILWEESEPGTQAIVMMIFQNPQSVLYALFQDPALATHSCANKIGSNSNSYGLSQS